MDLREALRVDKETPYEHISDDRLLAYPARRLPADEVAIVEKHLAACADCRALLAALAEPVPPAQRQWAEKALQRESPAFSRRMWIKRAAITAGAAAALFAFVTLRPASAPPPDYELEGPYGLVKPSRSAGEQTSTLTPDGTFEVRLLPVTTPQKIPAAALLIKEHGKLRRIVAELEERNDILRLRAPGRAMFGDRFGAQQIAVIVARDQGAIDRFAEGREVPNARVWTFEVEYRAPAEELPPP